MSKKKSVELIEEFEEYALPVSSNPMDADFGMGAKTPKGQFGKTLKKLLAYAKADIWLICTALIISVGAAVTALLAPNFMQDLVNKIRDWLIPGSSPDLNGIMSLGITIVIVYVVSALLTYANGWIIANITQKLSRKMRTDINQKIDRLPMSHFETNSTGDTLSIIANDADTVGVSLNNSVGILVAQITLILGSLFMMFYTNYIMAFTAIGATIIGFVATILIMSKSQKYFNDQRKWLGRINGHIEECYSGQSTIKVYNGQHEVINKFNKINMTLASKLFKSQALSSLMMPIMFFIDKFAYVVVIVVGALLVTSGTGGVTFGTIIAFIFYVRYFTSPLAQVAQYMQNLQSGVAASWRIFNFLDLPELKIDPAKETKTIKKIKGEVEFKHVKFGYSPDKLIIKDFSALAKPSQKIAIVGPTGAGKTTLVNLLMRFYEVNSGDITIDGVSIHQMQANEVRKMFCMVLQDTWLFEGTMRDNIVYSKANVTDQEIQAAIDAVGLTHYIKTLPHGLDTLIDSSVSLSEGQKQQITIARAMVQNAPMLILDEATSNVDTRTEIHIQNAMDKLMQNRTSFVIAHRLSTIKNADLILVLKDGDIIESGNHKQLLTKKGFYEKLYNSQFEQN